MFDKGNLSRHDLHAPFQRNHALNRMEESTRRSRDKKKKKRNIHESALRRVRFPQLDWSLERQETEISRVPQFHSSGNEDWDSNERSSNERDYEHAPSTIK